jgi:predicted nucleotidyltransferase
MYRSRLAGVVLYGSRARGDNRPDSDIDILVLLKEPIDWPQERWRLAELAADIGLETDEAPSFLLETEDSFADPTIFVQNVLEEGVLL